MASSSSELRKWIKTGIFPTPISKMIKSNETLITYPASTRKMNHFIVLQNSHFIFAFAQFPICILFWNCSELSTSLINVHTSKTQQRKSQTSNRFPFINLVFHPLNHTHTQSHAVNMLCRNEQHLIVKQNDFVILFRCVSGNKFVSNWKAKKNVKPSKMGKQRSRGKKVFQPFEIPFFFLCLSCSVLGFHSSLRVFVCDIV